MIMVGFLPTNNELTEAVLTLSQSPAGVVAGEGLGSANWQGGFLGHGDSWAYAHGLKSVPRNIPFIALL